MAHGLATEPEGISSPLNGGYAPTPWRRIDETLGAIVGAAMEARLAEGQSARAHGLEGVGPRLTLLREMQGLTKAELGELIGLDASSVTKVEKGTKPLLPPAAVEAADVFRVTLDYIYLGDDSGVSYRRAVEIRDRIARLQAERDGQNSG